MSTIHEKMVAATLYELNDMLDPSNVNISISWWGQRTVSIKGHAGSVKVNDLCLKYLDTVTATHKQSLETRLLAVELWDKIKQIYDESQTKLEKTVLYKYIVPLIEKPLYNCLYINTDSKGLHKEPIKYQFLEFSEEEFKRHWPGQPSTIPAHRKLKLDPADVFDATAEIHLPWFASTEMIREKCKK